jgi:hypothetical protein
MQPETLLAYVHAQPFRPFRITTADGTTYDVPYPRAVRVGREFVLFYFKNDPFGPYHRVDRIDLDIIAKVEHLAGLPAAATG